MAWFRKDHKRRRAQRERLEIPPDAWDKCEDCGHVDLSDKFDRALQVCPECGSHRRIGARRYIEILSDPDSFQELDGNLRSIDSLEFAGYPAQILRAQKKAGNHDAVITGHALLTGLEINLGAMEFAFMGGSMGSVVGEKIARLADRSLENDTPLVIVSASGGARMQEGVLSLMQMAKTSALIARMRSEGIPYVSILTNPTTGGVSASYGMQAGIQTFGYALVLMSDAAVEHVETGAGWELGAGPSIVVVDAGKARTMSTETMKDDVYAFTFGQKGLMAGMGLQGSKITKLER